MSDLDWTQAAYALSLLGWLLVLAGLIVVVFVEPARRAEEREHRPAVPAPAIERHPAVPAQDRRRVADVNRALPRLRTAPYVINPPYVSRVATSEYPQIRRELVNAYRGGEQR